MEENIGATRNCNCRPSSEGNVGNAIHCLSMRVSNFAKELSRIERELEELIQQGISDVNNKIDQEEERAKDKENQLEEGANQAGQDIQDNAGALTLLDQKIDQEIQDRQDAVTHETNRATGVEMNLADLLSQESTRALNAENELSNALTNEETRATNAERELQTAINNLNTQANGDLTNAFGLISAEETRAKAAEGINSGRLDVIESKIPNAASSSNKLADMDYVNSSVSTSTAVFHGNLNLISDLSLNTSATRQTIENTLAQRFGNTVDNNDYCFISIPTSDNNSQEIAITEKYKFNGSDWKFEYALNTSGFTSSQYAALNSGITSQLVGKLGNLPTNLELLELLAAKADKNITINNYPLSNNITLSKSDVGLGNVGNFKAVSTVANQGLDSIEQSNARANIGAGTSSLTLGTTAGTAYDGAAGDDLAARVRALELALDGMVLQKITSQAYTDLQNKQANTLYIIND